jgi:hypothetical protein
MRFNDEKANDNYNITWMDRPNNSIDIKLKWLKMS